MDAGLAYAVPPMKVDKWNVRLAEELAAARSRPFVYGEHDCLQFAARCVRATTGVDHAAPFGSYTDPAELLQAHGGVSGILTSVFGEMLHKSRASEGDIVLTNLSLGESAGICTGMKFAFATMPSGLLWVPYEDILGCWKP